MAYLESAIMYIQGSTLYFIINVGHHHFIKIVAIPGWIAILGFRRIKSKFKHISVSYTLVVWLYKVVSFLYEI